jgi:heat shock protein HslJ
MIALLSVAGCRTAKESRNPGEANVSESRKATGEENLTDRKWLLTEIGGKPVEAGQTGNVPHLTLMANGRVAGFGGCNTFMGNYALPGLFRIRFSDMAATLKACMDMTVETELMGILSLADNYSLSEDGKHLSLNRARMAPLARFEAE